MDLSEVRRKIDAVDEQMIRLLNERADLVHEVGVIKKAASQPIYAPEREEQVLRALAGKARDLKSRLPEKSIRAIYREIMSAALALEKPLTIAYFGPHATNTHQAARSKFGASVDYSACTTIADVFDAVARGRADYGVVPIESSAQSLMRSTLGAFMESELRICAQIHVRAETYLAAKCGKSEITRIYSARNLFRQYSGWLESKHPGVKLVEVPSAQRAARLAESEPHAAALVGRILGETYELRLLEACSPNRRKPPTCFLVIAPHAAPPTGDDGTALLLSLREVADAPEQAQALLQRLHLPVCKIKRGPNQGKTSAQIYYVDVEGHAEQPPLKKAIANLAKHCARVKILGTYPKTSAQP